MKMPCGCCEGVQVVTPAAIWNRPGLDALAYRVGTYSTFFETMLARISGMSLSIPALNATDPPGLVYPLRGVTTRDSSDPAIALLDAWSVVADVLTFYQERIANEGFLRTAIERRSLLELARLVGSRLRPGVSASVFLAFTLQNGSRVDIPAGTHAQSVPGPGELPQYFETSAVLPARDVWNSLQPRLTRPALITWDGDAVFDARNIDTLYLDGTSTNLNPNDALLLVSDNAGDPPILRRILAVTPDASNQRTRITLQLAHLLSKADQLLQTNGPNILSSLQQLIDDARTSFSGTSTADAIIARLNDLSSTLQQAMANNDAEAFYQALQADVAYIREQQAVAVERNYTRLAPWIHTLLSSLESDLDQFVNLPLGLLHPHVARKPSIVERAQSEGSLSLPLAQLARFLGPLSMPPSLQPANPTRLQRTLPQSLSASFLTASDGTARILRLLRSAASDQFYTAWSSVTSDPPAFRVYAMRTKVGLFGNSAPKEPKYQPSISIEIAAKPKADTNPTPAPGDILPQSEWPEWTLAGDEHTNQLYLERNVDQILPGSFIGIQIGHALPQIFSNISVEQISRNAYGVSSKTSHITLAGNDTWWDAQTGTDFSIIRTASVFAQSEQLTLAESPIDEDVAGAEIELAQLYDGPRLRPLGHRLRAANRYQWRYRRNRHRAGHDLGRPPGIWHRLRDRRSCPSHRSALAGHSPRRESAYHSGPGQRPRLHLRPPLAQNLRQRGQGHPRKVPGGSPRQRRWQQIAADVPAPSIPAHVSARRHSGGRRVHAADSRERSPLERSRQPHPDGPRRSQLPHPRRQQRRHLRHLRQRLAGSAPALRA